MALRLLFVIFALSLGGCGYNSFDQTTLPEHDDLAVNGSIADIVEGFQRRELVVGGVVTTSDSCGNFYKELFIQDPTTGAVLCLKVGLYDIYALFPVGANVVVRLTGLRIEWVEGLFVVELPRNMGVVASRMRLSREVARVEPLAVDIEQLKTVRAGRLVELDNLYFAGGGQGTYASRTELVQLPVDPVKPVTVDLYTSPYASFANSPLPGGVVTIRAIVLYNKGKVELKISDPSFITGVKEMVITLISNE